MDAFYASVEQLDNPELTGKCVIIGGSTNRGVVSSASYAARKFGVRSAMPIVTARKRCPEGIFIRPRIDRYKEVSREIMQILTRFSPVVEPVSIDEAYLDCEGCDRLHGSPAQMAVAIKQTIRKETGLTCSVGGAPHKFLAKIASDLKKPDGLHLIKLEEISDFISSLPINKVPGVGKTTRQKLYQIGIHTLGQVRDYPEAFLCRHFGKFGKRLKELAHGVDRSKVSLSAERKSVSTETTLTEDTSDRDLLAAKLRSQAETIGRQLRKMGVKARTITLKVKHDDFHQITRNTSLSHPTQTTADIYRQSLCLLQAYQDRRKVRLIGIGASGLVAYGTPVQQSLFADDDDGKKHWDQVDRVMDAIAERYGKPMVVLGKAPPSSKKNQS
jgi:DNA polymerase-4